jgi:hypothetical protein
VSEARPRDLGTPGCSFERSGRRVSPGRLRHVPSRCRYRRGLPGREIVLLDARVSFSSPWKARPLVQHIRRQHVFSPTMLFGADHTASPWLDLAEGRLCLDRLRRNGGRREFLPLGDHPTRRVARGPRTAHSSRGKKVYRRHPPLCSGPEATPSHRRDGDPDPRVRRRSPSASRSPSRPRWSRARNS